MRNLAQEARDLAAYKTVEAALPRRGGYRRVSPRWLAEVAEALDELERLKRVPPEQLPRLFGVGLDVVEDLRRQLSVAKRFAPDIVKCEVCGSPRAEGLRCSFCPPPVPKPVAEEHPDWRVEVGWDNDHGWIVEEPREDDGEMEVNDVLTDNDRVLKKDAVQWGIDLARKRQLPLRIYHKHSTRVTDIPLSEIL